MILDISKNDLFNFACPVYGLCFICFKTISWRHHLCIPKLYYHYLFIYVEFDKMLCVFLCFFFFINLHLEECTYTYREQMSSILIFLDNESNTKYIVHRPFATSFDNNYLNRYKKSVLKNILEKYLAQRLSYVTLSSVLRIK